MAMSEDEILDLWEQISGYQMDWDSIIMDLLDEIDNMRSQLPTSTSEDDYEILPGEEETTPDLESMRDTLLNLRRLIDNSVNAAKAGDMVQTELEEFFVKASATLQDVEQGVFELRELTQDFDIYELEDDIWGEEEEE